MKQITYQEGFNRAWNHFIVNNAHPGYNYKQQRCFYNRDGLKCAIGIQIPEAMQPLIKEGRAFSGLPEPVKEVFENYEHSVGRFWDWLQAAHDDAARCSKDVMGEANLYRFKKLFQKALTELAEEYKLEIPTKRNK